MDDLLKLVDYTYQLRIPIFLRRLIPAGKAEHESLVALRDYEVFRKKLARYLSDPQGLVQGHYISQKLHSPRIQLPFEWHDCSAGHRGMVILPDGKIQTCGFLGPAGESHVGKVPEESFSAIWERLLESDHMRCLRGTLLSFNWATIGPKTNCLAIALSCAREEGGA